MSDIPNNEAEDLLLRKLWEDVEQICRVLIDAFDLTHKKEISHLSSSFMRWLDFRFRYVHPKPRKVRPSDLFPKVLEEDAKRGLQFLLRKFERGEDVNPYQGRGLKYRNDTSGAKHATRTDLLFADWGILHFHLTDEFISAERYFSKSSDWLAFCMVTSDQVALLDVRPHGDKVEFADPELLQIAIRTWPEAFEIYRIKGITPIDQLTKEQTHALREGSGNTFFTYQGAVYAGPGGGVMSSGTPAKIAHAEARLDDCLLTLVKLILEPSGQFLVHPLLKEIKRPDFSLCIHADGLGVYERNSKILFKLPAVTSQENCLFLWMFDLILPTWAMAQVMASREAFDTVLCEPATSWG